MKVTKFKCPNCGFDLGPAIDFYLYGSPFQVCKKCKKTYVDPRYHEIAVEGIRREDIEPTEEDKKANRKSGWTTIGLGLVMFAAFVLGLFIGVIAIPLPFLGVILLIGGIGTMKRDNKKALNKRRQELELEKQQSFLRVQDPQYVEKLRSIGYHVKQTTPPPAAASSQPPVCAACGTELDDNVRFCPNCGTPR